MSVASNVREVLERIARAEGRAGRPPGSVRLVAVSKTHPPERVREAYAAGLRDFGENYAQSLVEKADALADLADVRWHFVGHLQRNKVKLLAGRVVLLHGADSVRLLDEIDRRGGGDVLVEVNLAGEASKSGVAPSEVESILATPLERTRVRGLMCIPPPGDTRPYFERLRELRDTLGGAERLPELSMGMTDDFEAAIEEGATWVRVGTAIFDARARSLIRGPP